MMAVFDRFCVRSLMTVFMLVGVALFVVPMFHESLSTGLRFLVGGAVLAVVCGSLRCYLDGSCNEARKRNGGV